MLHKSSKNFYWLLWVGLFLLFSTGISLWLNSVPLSQMSHSDLFPHAPAEEQEWNLPTLKKETNLNNAYQMLIQKNPWGEGKTDEQGFSSGKWRLTGVVHIFGKPFALIEINHLIQRYTSGDILPGGEVLQSIHDDHIKILVENNIRIIKLYMEKDPKGLQNP